MPSKTTTWYTLGEAEKASGIPRTRLDHACRVGRLPYRRTESGARLLSQDVVEKLRKQGLSAFPRPYDPPNVAAGPEASASAALSATLRSRRDRLEEAHVRIEELRARQQLDDLREEIAERRARKSAEKQAAAMIQQEEREQRHLRDLREVQAREDKAREDGRSYLRRQWVTTWTDYALDLLPKDAPHSVGLEAHQAIAEVLGKLDPDQPGALIRRLMRTAVDKALGPWQRRKETEKTIQQAGEQLPALARGWPNSPSEWEVRARRAAAEAIERLKPDAPLEEIRAAALEAGNRVRTDYEAWQVAEEHRQNCKRVLDSAFPLGDSEEEREASKRAVREALEKLPVGCELSEMQRARDQALAPFKVRAEAAKAADRLLRHVDPYIEDLGNEESGDWDLGGFSERRQLAQKLKAKVRPALIEQLFEKKLDETEIQEFIEDWIDEELELDS